MSSRAGPVVYVASALSGDIEGNVEKTKKYSSFVARSGACPLNPILNLHGVISEETGRDEAMAMDLSLLQRCDEVWAFGKLTAGMRMEIEEAKRIGLPIRMFTTDFKEADYGKGS